MAPDDKRVLVAAVVKYGTDETAATAAEAAQFYTPGGGVIDSSRSAAVRTAEEFLGPNPKVITNSAGDKIFLSGDGARRVRFDIRAPLKTLELACLPRRRGARRAIRDRKEKGDGSVPVLFSFPRRSPSPSLRRLLSDGDRQPQEPLEMIREMLQANLRSCPHPPHGAKAFPAHGRAVMA